MEGESGRGGQASLWWLLLLIPFFGVLFPQVYNSMTPALGGLPYFYWYQLLWVVISAVIVGFVWLVTR